MTGGLLNLSAYGNQNIFFNGNPKKTYFKSTYNKYTNFGMQRFRINYEGTRSLNGTSDTILTYKIPRYADLLYESFFVINLPNIWSPFYFKQITNNNVVSKTAIPFQFKWIEELGSTMIKSVEIKSGGTVISKFSGEYLSCLIQRDYNEEKKKLWNKMTGNIPEVFDPANSHGRINVYPNVFFKEGQNIEPSIRERKLYIPLNAFFSDSSKMSLPLVALQYQEIFITITLRPLYDLYTINNIDAVTDDNTTGISYRIRPNPNEIHHQLWKFLQPPINNNINNETGFIPRDGIGTFWIPDPHIISTFIFLGDEERRVFAQNEHKFLIKQLQEYEFLGVHGSKVVEMESKNVISNYMWRFRRNDVKERNEWSNYTNWPYKNMVQTIRSF